MKIGCWYINDEGLCEFDDSYVGPIDIPVVATACSGMFAYKNIKEGCYLNDFDTSRIDNFNNMFRSCTIPEGFTFGPKFDTSFAKSMRRMFAEAKLPRDFKLGEKFSIPVGADCEEMFAEAIFAPGVVLPKEVTSKDSSVLKDAKYEDGTPYDANAAHTAAIASAFGAAADLDFSQEQFVADMFYAAWHSLQADPTKLDKSFLPYRPVGMTEDEALSVFIQRLEYVHGLVTKLQNGSGDFDADTYLMELFGPRYKDIPHASIEQCKTKEDCDDLYSRLYPML